MSDSAEMIAYVEDDEGGAVAGGEGWDWLQDTIFGTRSFAERGQLDIYFRRRLRRGTHEVYPARKW